MVGEYWKGWAFGISALVYRLSGCCACGSEYTLLGTCNQGVGSARGLCEVPAYALLQQMVRIGHGYRLRRRGSKLLGLY